LIKVRQHLIVLYKVCTLPMVVFGFLLLIWLQVGIWYTNVLIDDAKAAANEVIWAHGNSLSRSLSDQFSLINRLVDFGQSHTSILNLQETFPAVASGLQTEASAIRVIMIHFVDGSYIVYPSIGNSGGLGVYFQSKLESDLASKRLETSFFAESRDIYTVGPYQLFPNNWEIAVYKPVYHSGKWAATAVIVYALAPLLEDSGLNQQESTYQFGLLDHNQQLLLGNEPVLHENPAALPVRLPFGYWELRAVPATGWKGMVQREWLVFQAGGLICVAVITLLALNLNLSFIRLKAAVQHSTQSLQIELENKQRSILALRESEEKFRSLVTRRKQIERALLESEERFRMLFEQAPLGYQSLDSEGCILDVNQAWLNMLGYTKEEVVGRWVGDFLPPSWQLAFSQRFPQFKQSGFIKDVEFDMFHKDGRLISIVSDGRVGRTLDGEFMQTHCILQNITERKKTEEALRRSEERLRLALQAANQGLYDINMLTGEVLINPDYPLMNEYDLEPDMNSVLKWARKIHPEDRKSVIEAYDEYRQGLRKDHNVEFRFKTHSGKWVWMLAHGKIVEWNSLGKPVRFLGTLTDISKMKRVEAELRESERRFRLAESLAHLGHWHRKLDSDDNYCSEELLRIYGLVTSLPFISFKKFLGLVHPEDQAELLRKREEVNRNTLANYEYRIIRSDGLMRNLSVISMLEYDEQKLPVGYFGVVIDITDLKQKERDLAAKNAEIERFTYTISHDLKSPLVTIKTFLGYLEHDIASSDSQRIEQDKYYIRTAVDKMSLLLDEILQFSRVGRVQSPPAAVCFQDIAGEALKMVAGAMAEKNVNVKLDDVNISLLGDRQRLVQIWQNLIDNAVKFMGSQKNPYIEIGVIHGDELTFFVSDNGIGIDPAFHEKIFDLFEKLENQTEGTGMGLALAKRIVEYYQGRIWVESAGNGTGSCFLFTLPQTFPQRIRREPS
jgi:PAS domain S-box-containing protein